MSYVAVILICWILLNIGKKVDRIQAKMNEPPIEEEADRDYY